MPVRNQAATREKAYWVKPELVARVKYGGWTEGRHLRQPTFLGFQDDHDPKECTFEKESKEVKPRSAKQEVQSESKPMKPSKNCRKSFPLQNTSCT